jgi:hypothetical protein
VANTSPETSYVIGRLTFEKISEVEGIHLSGQAKRALSDPDLESQSGGERRRTIVRRLKQTTS